MKLIIDIPEETVNEIKDNVMFAGTIPSEILWDVTSAIVNGTLLPKGHGKLVDVGQCDRKLFYKQCGGEDSLITVKSAFDMLMSLPPIIEADTTESED